MTVTCFVFLVSVMAAPAPSAAPQVSAFPAEPFNHRFIADASTGLHFRVIRFRGHDLHWNQGDVLGLVDHVTMDSLGNLKGQGGNRGHYDRRTGVLIWNDQPYAMDPGSAGKVFPRMPFEHTFVARDSFPASLMRCGQWLRLRVEFGKDSATLFSEEDAEDFRALSMDSVGVIRSGEAPNHRMIGRYDSRNGVLLWKGGLYDIE